MLAVSSKRLFLLNKLSIYMAHIREILENYRFPFERDEEEEKEDIEDKQQEI